MRMLSFFLFVFLFSFIEASYFMPLNVNPDCDRNPCNDSCPATTFCGEHGESFCNSDIPYEVFSVAILPVFLNKSESDYYEQASYMVRYIQEEVEEYLVNSDVIHVYDFMPPQFINHSGSSSDFISDARNGEINNLAALRNKFGADIVVLFDSNFNEFGEAWAIPAPDKERAVAIVKINTASALSFTVAHEIGHLMGAVHDYEDNDDSLVKPLCSYAHGYCTPSGQVGGNSEKTIMAKGCLDVSDNYLLSEFSTDQQYKIFYPEEITRYHKVAKLINLYAPYISSFYEEKMLCVDEDDDDVCDDENRFYNYRDAYDFYSNLEEEEKLKFLNGVNVQSSLFDMKDNCPDKYNPVASYSLKNEFISGEFGAIANQLGQLGFEFSGFTWRYVYKMQPDSDLDGIGDACDYNSASGDGFANSRITNIKPQTPSFMDSPILFEKKYNKYAKINLTMPFGSGRESVYCNDNNLPGIPGMPGTGQYRGSICNAAVHYCAINYLFFERGRWGTPGYCTVAGDSNSFFQYGFSHGSDNFSQESRRSWESRISVADSSADTNPSKWPDFTGSDNPNDDPARKKVTVGHSIFSLIGSETPTIWNWRRDWYEKSRCFDNPSEDFCQSLKFARDYNESHTMYYALSTSILPVTADTFFEDIPPYLEGSTYLINDDYFPETNPNVNARAARYPTYLSRPLELNYYRKPGWIPPSVPGIIEIPEIIHAPDYYWNISLKDILDEDGIPEASSINNIGRWFLGKDENGSYQMSSQQLYFLGEMMFCSEMTEHEMVAVKTVELPATGGTEYQLLLNTSESGAAWESLGIINNWDSEITSIRTVVSTDTGLYFIAETHSQRQYGQYLFRISVDGSPEITDPENLPEITYSLQNLGLTEIGDDTLEDEELVSVDGKLFVIGADSAGAGTRTFKLTNDAALFEEITGSAPVGRKIYNLKVSGKYIFLIGGMDDNNGSINDLWRFDTENEIWEQIPAILQGDFRKVITQVVDGKLVMANPVIDGNTTHPAFEIDPNIEDINDLAGNLNYIVIPVTEVEYIEGDDYCLYNDGTFILGGREQGGTCAPFTVPQYDNYSVGSTVYTLSGSGTKLAVGTGNDVKIYDITDPLDPVLEHTQNIYGPASDILIRNNKLIVAVENGIDTIDMSDYSYIHTATYGTTKALEIYNGKLYAGDGQGIKVFDPDTLTLIQQLNTSGDITQLEIFDGTIHTFEWVGLKRYNAETLESVQTDNYYVDNPETFVYNSKFYIYKSNSTVELIFNGSTVTETSYVGDEVELRNHYSYGNYTYFPAGTNVRISTIEENPVAICGNGVVETGEVCDENSVACTTLSSDYDSGTAYCNSLCFGYNEDNCEGDDGW